VARISQAVLALDFTAVILAKNSDTHDTNFNKERKGQNKNQKQMTMNNDKHFVD